MAALTPPPRPVRFVFSEKEMRWGSTTMRAHQLIGLLAPHLASMELALAPLRGGAADWIEAQPENAIFFVTKTSIQRLHRVFLDKLRAKGGEIWFDYVDRRIDQMRPDGIDVHLASSLAQFRAMTALKAARGIKGRVGLLLHNVDARLYDLPPPPADRFRLAYLGARDQTRIAPALEARIAFLDAGSVRAMAASLTHLPHYNAHFCVRPDPDGDAPPRVLKPFTKGFTAAVCGAVPIVNRSVPDAVEMLGADYPYLIESARDDLVAEAVARAETGFGGRDWARAADRARGLAEHVSPAALARSFAAIAEGADGNFMGQQ